jgi:hypothetical protein
MVGGMFDPKVPFRGSTAVRDGLRTRARLRRDFVALYRDVYLAVDVEPTLPMKSRAAHLVCQGRGVLAGHSATTLLPPTKRPTATGCG